MRPIRRLQALGRLRRRRRGHADAARLMRLIEDRLNVQLGDVPTEDLRRACRAALRRSKGRTEDADPDSILRSVVDAVNGPG